MLIVNDGSSGTFQTFTVLLISLVVTSTGELLSCAVQLMSMLVGLALDVDILSPRIDAIVNESTVLPFIGRDVPLIVQSNFVPAGNVPAPGTALISNAIDVSVIAYTGTAADVLLLPAL